MNKIIGYSRKSTLTQTNEPDVAALKEAGAEIVFEEKISSRKAEKDRPQLQAALTALRSGDELVITKLDRLGRSQVEVVNRLHELQAQGINVELWMVLLILLKWESSHLFLLDYFLVLLKLKGV